MTNKPPQTDTNKQLVTSKNDTIRTKRITVLFIMYMPTCTVSIFLWKLIEFQPIITQHEYNIDQSGAFMWPFLRKPRFDVSDVITLGINYLKSILLNTFTLLNIKFSIILGCIQYIHIKYIINNNYYKLCSMYWIGNLIIYC